MFSNCHTLFFCFSSSLGLTKHSHPLCVCITHFSDVDRIVPFPSPLVPLAVTFPYQTHHAYVHTYIFLWSPWPDVDSGPIPISTPDLRRDDVTFGHIERLHCWGRGTHKLLPAGETLHLYWPGGRGGGGEGKKNIIPIEGKRRNVGALAILSLLCAEAQNNFGFNNWKVLCISIQNTLSSCF